MIGGGKNLIAADKPVTSPEDLQASQKLKQQDHQVLYLSIRTVCNKYTINIYIYIKTYSISESVLYLSPLIDMSVCLTMCLCQLKFWTCSALKF